MKFLLILAILFLCSCSASYHLKKEIAARYDHYHYFKSPINIDSMIHALSPLTAREREKQLVPLMLNGNIPPFLLDFKKIEFTYADSLGKKYKATLFVSPDYLSIGNDLKFMRMPLTPQAAQSIADSLHAVLPTKKMVDLIYLNSDIKLEPRPLTDHRDSLPTFLQHDSIIQQQLGFRHITKLVAGIKKDVVQSPNIYTASRPNRVAIYGWHQLNGKAIQPLYAGHVDWYVDYSHGIRLVYEKMIIDGKLYFITAVLNDPVLSKLICDEAVCGYTRYADSQ